MPTAFSRQHPVWRAPLVPVALAMTAGIVLDRVFLVPLPVSIGVGLASLLAALAVVPSSQPWLPLIYLWCSVIGWGAAYHHWQRYRIAADDISHFASSAKQPACLRGTLESAPIMQPGQPADALRSFPKKDVTRFVLRVTQRQDLTARSWYDVTGLVQVTLFGHVEDVMVGDEVELLGKLALPGEAMNAGGFDYASFLHDQGITATLTVLESDEVFLLRRGGPLSLQGWLAVLRGWGQRTLKDHVSSQHKVAAALLLGEDSGMSGEDWEKYRHTGVIHVLAISGQHLVILAAFVWLFTRALCIRRRHAALFVALVLVSYALLTGGRPSVMRAAWVIVAYCGALLLRRPVARGNTFALAWIVVALVNPSDVFNAGCQLSFLAVAVLIWGVASFGTEPANAQDQPIDESHPWIASAELRRLLRWLSPGDDPLQQLIDEARSWYMLAAIRFLRWLVICYAINAAVWFALTPLSAAHFHQVSPVALLIGPPMVLLTTLALFSGFGCLLFAAWFAPLAGLFGLATQGLLWCCEKLVSLGLWLPCSYCFVTDVPAWWLWIFYLGLLVGITLPIVWHYGRWALLAAGVWLLLGVLLEILPHRPGEFRCSFVAVGHGGCTVIEAPNGHVTVYDAGEKNGPEVTSRHIAPFLWSRGIRRIDDLILSHADLDHFNGVKDLTGRFTIGRTLCTPTFAERELAAMRETLAALDRSRIPRQIVHAGQRWEVDGVTFEVLHPPLVGPDGKENARSLVLRVNYADCTILLTGDLEEAGLVRVLNLPPPNIDVLMAPHHGSDTSNIPALANWAKPKIVASCQEVPLNERASVKMYQKLGIPFLPTSPHGTVTVRHNGREAWVETYRTQLVLKLTE